MAGEGGLKVSLKDSIKQWKIFHAFTNVFACHCQVNWVIQSAFFFSFACICCPTGCAHCPHHSIVCSLRGVLKELFKYYLTLNIKTSSFALKKSYLRSKLGINIQSYSSKPGTGFKTNFLEHKMPHVREGVTEVRKIVMFLFERSWNEKNGNFL